LWLVGAVASAHAAGLGSTAHVDDKARALGPHGKAADPATPAAQPGVKAGFLPTSPNRHYSYTRFGGGHMKPWELRVLPVPGQPGFSRFDEREGEGVMNAFLNGSFIERKDGLYLKPDGAAGSTLPEQLVLVLPLKANDPHTVQGLLPAIYTVQQHVQLSTPAGSFDTVRIERQSEGGKSITWVTPGVGIVKIQDGKGRIDILDAIDDADAAAPPTCETPAVPGALTEDRRYRVGCVIGHSAHVQVALGEEVAAQRPVLLRIVALADATARSHFIAEVLSSRKRDRDLTPLGATSDHGRVVVVYATTSHWSELLQDP
jgi:hypothetical protein